MAQRSDGGRSGPAGWRRAGRLLVVAVVMVAFGTGCSESVVAGPAVESVASPSPSPSLTPTAASSTATAAPTTAAASSPAPTSPAPTSATPTSSAAPSPTGPAPDRSVSCPPPAGLLGQDLERLPTDEKVVALTFDAGANADAVDSVLATLAAKNVTGTFFLTGDFVTTFPDKAALIGARYPVGNHSRSHPDLTTLSDAQVRDQLASAQASIAAATGRDPRPFFRFPFGAVDAHRISLVNEQCYIPFRWTADTLGWKGTSGGQSADSVRDRALAKLRPGEIVLMHLGSNPDDGSILDADALPGMIDAMRAQGYSFVTLETVL